ncbi:MAG: acetolactate synthase 2 catalytic subunit [Wenzhouxiangellaceae bacterium]
MSTGKSATSPNGAQLLIDSLKRQGVSTVFGYPGGAIMPLYDLLPGSGIRHILTRHEQAAALAADAYGRVTGEPGVCMATSGPGATNLITGIANAFLDSSPLVAITGQVATSMMGTDAFQEVDIFGMTMPVVKHSYIIRDAAQVPAIVDEAFDLARSGRPGPVLVDLPKDVSLTPCQPRPYAPATNTASAEPAAAAIDAAVALLEQARRPVAYIGGGVRIADAVDALRQWLGDSGIPVVSTLQGLGCVTSDHPDCLGMLGMHGNPAANKAVQSADLLIVIGARFDDRATGKLDLFAPDAAVLHIDADPAEISKLRIAQAALTGDLHGILQALPPAPPAPAQWRQQCHEWRRLHAPRYDAPGDDIYAPALLKRLTELDDDLLLACDVGQHQMWVAQHCHISHPRRHLTSGGLGTMGFGLPAAIGAKLAAPQQRVVCITGDGSIMMNLQELATLRRYGIDIRIILLDNSALGMVRQWQELFFDGNYSEIDLSDNPDFTQVAQAFGINAFHINRRDQVEQGLQRLLHADGPTLMHVSINPRANVWPLVPPGQSNAQMMGEHAL